MSSFLHGLMHTGLHVAQRHSKEIGAVVAPIVPAVIPIFIGGVVIYTGYKIYESLSEY